MSAKRRQLVVKHGTKPASRLTLKHSRERRRAKRSGVKESGEEACSSAGYMGKGTDHKPPVSWQRPSETSSSTVVNLRPPPGSFAAPHSWAIILRSARGSAKATAKWNECLSWLNLLSNLYAENLSHFETFFRFKNLFEFGSSAFVRVKNFNQSNDSISAFTQSG